MNNYLALSARTMADPSEPLSRLIKIPHLLRHLLVLRRITKEVELRSDALKREIFYGQDKELANLQIKDQLSSFRMGNIAAKLNGDKVNGLHGALGILSEAGEYFDQQIGWVVDNQELDRINVIEEIGDLFWYMAIPARDLGFTFDDAQSRNIAKLSKRYPDRFDPQQAAIRDLQGERQTLENAQAPEATELDQLLVQIDGHVFGDGKIVLEEEDGGVLAVWKGPGDGDYRVGVGGSVREALENLAPQLQEHATKAAPPPEEMTFARLHRDADMGRQVAEIANEYGWNGVDNSKILPNFISAELHELARLRKIMADAQDAQNFADETHQRRQDAKSTTGTVAEVKAEWDESEERPKAVTEAMDRLSAREKDLQAAIDHVASIPPPERE